MRVLIVAVGTRMPEWVSDAFEDYARRMPAHERFELIEVKPERRARNMGTDLVLAHEARRIETVLPQGCTRVVLDERGRVMTSLQFARELERWCARGKDIAFLIGGAEGLAAELKTTACAQLSLSAMRLPHALARVLLAEQLYRAHAISRGHPYHRD